MANSVNIITFFEAAPPVGFSNHSLMDEELSIVVECLKHDTLLGVVWRRELNAGDSGIPSIFDRDRVVKRRVDIENLVDDLGEDNPIHECNVEVDQQVAEETEDLFQVLHNR